MEKKYRNSSEITPEILDLTKLCVQHNHIVPQMYIEHDVKRGLRDLSGKGVVTGLTEISEIESSKMVNGESVSCEGRLFYRGYDVRDLAAGFMGDKRFGFEEATYLLLFGNLPSAAQLKDFNALLAEYRLLPVNFVRDIIMKAPSADMMDSRFDTPGLFSGAKRISPSESVTARLIFLRITSGASVRAI